MAATLLPRSGPSRGIIALIQQQLQIAPIQQMKCQLYTSDKAATADAASAVDAPGIKSYEEIPGPAPLPIIGNSWRFLPYIGEYHRVGIQDLHRAIHKKYGKIVLLGGFPGRVDMLCVYHPDDVETVLRNEGPWPIRQGMQAMEYYRKVIRKDFYKDGTGLLTEQGSKWMEARSKVNQPMMQPRISKRYIQPIAGVAQEFVDKIRTLKDEKEELPKDFMNELFKWSLESIAYVALDTRMGCLAPDLPPDSEPQRLIKAVGDFFECFFLLEMGLPVWKVYPTATWKRFVKALDVFLEVSVKYVEEAIQRINHSKAEGNDDGEPSVLERLLARADAKTASIMAQDMIFGGVDSTSYSVAMAMYQLSKNQDKQELLFRELKRLLPNKNEAITEEMLEDMKYLRACLKESARTLPIISGNMRTTVKELVLSNYKVPKGELKVCPAASPPCCLLKCSDILDGLRLEFEHIVQHSMHCGLWMLSLSVTQVLVLMPNTISMLSEEFFPLSEKFIPERWLKNRPTEDTTGCAEDFDAVSKGKRHPYAFIPFGFGPRSCVGKRFAVMEMEILLSKMVRNFRIEYNYGEMEFVSQIFNIPKDPLRFKMTERQD